jgi:hypothetical protein
MTIKFLAPPKGDFRQQQRQEAQPPAAPVNGLESDPEELPF